MRGATRVEPQADPPPAGAGSRRSVFVGGAGFAGLAAALRLAEQGIRVTILEARDRVGGRVHSITLSNGTVAEMGAEWIEPDESAVRALAERVGVELLPAGVAYRRRDAAGPMGASRAEQDAALAVFAAARSAIPAGAVGSTSLGAFIDGLALSVPQRVTLRARLQGTFGADLADVALRAADGYGGDHAGAASDLRADGGNQRIAEAAAKRLPDVRLRHMVKRIDHSDPNGDGPPVVVRGESPSGPFTVEADAAVVAVPAPLILDLVFTPSLAAEVRTALRDLPMGIAAKLAVPVEPAPSPRAIQEVDAPFWCWAAAEERGAPRSALTSFAGSAAAMAALAVGSGDPEPWLARMLALNNDLRRAGDPVMTAWEADPLARGCYAAFDNRSFDRRDLLLRPSGRVAFAGEHTAGAVGTMNCAVQTGQRAAADVLEMLGRVAP
jgi:monoamine oxidase